MRWPAWPNPEGHGGYRRRPGGGVYAQYARNDHRHAGRRQHRSHLVFLLPGFRHQRGAGSLRPDQTQGALHRRRILVQGKKLDSLERITDILKQIRLRRKGGGGALHRRCSPISAPFPMPCIMTISNRPNPNLAIEFEQLPFDHPLYIMYSSGTTGLPKCMVQSAGGILIHQMKEHILHTDLKREDTIFYFTTCGWMMWNWLTCALGRGRHPGAL